MRLETVRVLLLAVTVTWIKQIVGEHVYEQIYNLKADRHVLFKSRR